MYEYRVIEKPRVVDGDTLDVVFDLGFSVHTKQRVRLDGVDTPETRTTNLNEKRYGTEAKVFLEEWIKTNTGLWARTSKDDKYGRMLVVLFSDASSVSVNDQMVFGGYAWRYSGNAKSKDFAALDRARNTTK